MLTKALVKLAGALPLINIIAGFSTNLSGEDSLHLGVIRGALLVVLVLVILFRHPAGNPVTIVMVSFFAYLLTLLLASSNIAYSFNGTYIKVFSSMMLYAVGYHYIRTILSLRKALNYFAFGIGLLCVNYIVAQIFKLGQSVYLEDSFYYGYAGIGTTVVLCYFVIVFPLFDKLVERRPSRALSLLAVLSALFTIVAMKRIAIVAMLAGLIILIFMNHDLGRWTKRLAAAGFVLVLALPLYGSALQERIAARTTERNYIRNEARLGDLELALDRFWKSDLRQAFFGTELFNTPALVRAGRDSSLPESSSQARQVHVDYANLMMGAGAVGLAWYLLIHVVIWREFGKWYHRMRSSLRRARAGPAEMKRIYTIRAVFTALLVASLLVSFSGGIHAITPRAFVFLMLGALTGTLRTSVRGIRRSDHHGHIRLEHALTAPGRVETVNPSRATIA